MKKKKFILSFMGVVLCSTLIYYFCFAKTNINTSVSRNESTEIYPESESSTHLLGEDKNLSAYYTTIYEERPIVFSKRIKDIQIDLGSLSPCKFLAKYQNYEDKRDLWLALVGANFSETPLSFFFLKKLSSYEYEFLLSKIESNESVFEYYSLDLREYLRNKSDVEYELSKKVNFKQPLKQNVRAFQDKIEAHNLGFIYSFQENMMNRLRNTSQINPLYLRLMLYNVNSKVSNTDDLYYDYYRSISNETNEVFNNFLHEFNKTTVIPNLIPIKFRDQFLSLAKNETEMALTYSLYNRTKTISYRNLIRLDQDLAKDDKSLSRKFRGLLKRYVAQSIYKNDASYLDRDLYLVLSFFDSRLKGINYDDFIEGKKMLLDPIYGKGCDDRRYIEICDKFCKSNNN